MKNKGFTIVELMIAVTIMMILAATGFISFSGRAERNALIEMKTQIPTFVENAAQRSLERGESHTITFNLSTNTITLHDSDGTEVDDLDLDDVLEYAYITASSIPTNSAVIVTTTQGDIDADKNLYVFDRDGEAQYRIDFITGLPTDYVGITTYEVSETADSMLIFEAGDNHIDDVYGDALVDPALNVVDDANWTED